MLCHVLYIVLRLLPTSISRTSVLFLSKLKRRLVLFSQPPATTGLLSLSMAIVGSSCKCNHTVLSYLTWHSIFRHILWFFFMMWDFIFLIHSPLMPFCLLVLTWRISVLPCSLGFCHTSAWITWLPHASNGVLVPWPGVGPVPPAVEAWSLNRWAAREVPLVLGSTQNFRRGSSKDVPLRKDDQESIPSLKQSKGTHF